MKQPTMKKTPSETTKTRRRAWTTPTAEFRGTVAELVQIAKTSGNQDCSGHRRNNTGTHC